MGMRISSGSSGMERMGGVNNWQQKRQDFNQLASAIKAGDLSSAQKAFETLASKSPNAASGNGPLAELGKALQAGNINAAQQAMSSMKSGGHHHHQAEAAPTTNNTSLASGGLVGTLINSFA